MLYAAAPGPTRHPTWTAAEVADRLAVPDVTVMLLSQVHLETADEERFTAGAGAAAAAQALHNLYFAVSNQVDAVGHLAH
jgi:hypothetical protein